MTHHIGFGEEFQLWPILTFRLLRCGDFIIYFGKQSKRAIPCCVGMLNMTWPCSKSFIMCEDFIQRQHNTAARHVPEQLVFRFSCLIWRPPPNTNGTQCEFNILQLDVKQQVRKHQTFTSQISRRKEWRVFLIKCKM